MHAQGIFLIEENLAYFSEQVICSKASPTALPRRGPAGFLLVPITSLVLFAQTTNSVKRENNSAYLSSEAMAQPVAG